ncbi:MAG TPA: type II secretion system secretin GspD [Burkholderiaceae bacterium]|nr:type II secretion system secretin GspD [Burkholderiaceae bacterium]
MSLARSQGALVCSLALAIATSAAPTGAWAQRSTQPAVAGETASAPAQGPRAARNQAVTLNFVNAEIEGVSRAIAAILDRQIVVDPRVKGQITLYSEQPLTPRQAYINFLAALRGLGFTVVETAGLLKVVPEADAKLQTGTVSVGPVTRTGDQIITQVFRVNHENVNNLVAVLRPLISPNNTINANPSNNTLVITDYADNLQRLARIIAAMDMPGNTDVEVIPLQHAVASDLVPVVQRLSDGGTAVPGAAAVTPGALGGGGGALSVMADARTNSLLVRAQNPARLATIKSLIEKLDRPGIGGAGGSNVYVVYLRNAESVRLAQVLRAAFAAQAQASQTGAPGQQGAQPSGGAQPQPQQTGYGGGGIAGTGASPQATAPVNAVAQPSLGGFIQADPATNSLIITASEPLYRQLRAAIDQLDSRRAQVYVEAMIVEIDATRAADLGIQWQAFSGQKGDNTITAGGTNFGTGTDNILEASRIIAGGRDAIAAAALPSQGFNIALAKKFGDFYTLGFLARALESNVGANILSTPNLITLDNEEAKIVVGQNVPFVTGQYTGQSTTATGSINPFQTIERKDVGLTLRLRPQIGEGGTVRMTIFQESSAIVNQTVPGTVNAGPATTKRSIESTVVVDDGQIIVLGGLIEDSYADERGKIPLLGDIPVLGHLFRSENRTRKKTNLMVFLRPVIMRDQDAASRVTLDRYDMIRTEQINTMPAARPLIPVDAPLLPAPGAPAVPGSTVPPSPRDVPLQPVTPGASQPQPVPITN